MRDADLDPKDPATPAMPAGADLGRRDARPRTYADARRPSARRPGAEAETPQTAAIAAGPDRSSGGTCASARRRAARVIARLAIALAGGAALVAGIAVPVSLASRPSVPAVSTAAVAAGLAIGAAGAQEDEEASVDGEAPSAEPSAPKAAVWRVAQLADDASVTLIDGAIARRPLLTALGAAGLPGREAQRVVRSLAEVRDVDRFGPKDTFALARDKASGRVVAYEVASSPTDVWQAREEGEGTPRLVARKLELLTERVRIRKVVVVGADLRASFVEAGLSPIDDVLSMLDDALEGHAELADIRPGARLRLVATQERVDGAFARWASLDAVEYFPAAPNVPPVRVYLLPDDERPRDHHGWYDAKGRQPYHGGWRSPIPLARIASRFNPHRMHPVLHVVMPHNGVDFVAVTGTPVYATAAGVVSSTSAPAGPAATRSRSSIPEASRASTATSIALRGRVFTLASIASRAASSSRTSGRRGGSPGRTCTSGSSATASSSIR